MIMVRFLSDENGHQMFPNSWGWPTSLSDTFKPPPKLSLQPEHKIITPEEFAANNAIVRVDPSLINYFQHNPKALYDLEPRKFEDFVAEILSRFGYQVQLTGKGPDDGVDIFATKKTRVGSTELAIVQCKRYAENNKVNCPIVKQFYADVRDRNATIGLFVTTSSFTGPANLYIERFHTRLTGIDFDAIKNWLDTLTLGFED
jgi:restriction endonuclease Mrr